MSRVFWDTMLFVSLIEDNPEFAPRVREVLDRSYSRADTLLTSHLAVGEVMAGGRGNVGVAAMARSTIVEIGFSCLPFDSECLEEFSRLRFAMRLKAPDAIHLACAGAAAVDLFLTGDKALLKRRLHVPGIHFIADFNLPIL